ncbi:hypothetical protein MTO96_049815 [Rhipicephalus appendiculatus]
MADEETPVPKYRSLSSNVRAQAKVRFSVFLSFGWNTGVLVTQVEFFDNLPACDFDGFFGEQPSTTQPPCLAVLTSPVRPAAGSYYQYAYTSLYPRLERQCAAATLSTVPPTEQINLGAAKSLVSGHGSMYGMTGLRTFPLFVQIFGFLSFGWNTGVLVTQVEFFDNLPACDFDGFFGEQPSTTQPPCLAVLTSPVRPAAGSYYQYAYTSLYPRLERQCAAATLSTVPPTEQINLGAAKSLVSGHGSMYGMTGLRTFPLFVQIFGFLSFGWNTGVLVTQVEFFDNLPACDFDGFFGEQPSTTQPPCLAVLTSPVRPAAGSYYQYAYTSLYPRLERQCAAATLSTVPPTEQINLGAAKSLVSGHGSMYGMTGLRTFPLFVQKPLLHRSVHYC